MMLRRCNAHVFSTSRAGRRTLSAHAISVKAWHQIRQMLPIVSILGTHSGRKPTTINEEGLRMARIEYPGGDSRANPLVVVEPDEVTAWLRGLADQLGLSDRVACAVQVDFPLSTDKPTPEHIASPPRLVLMVSNIPNSRS